MTIAPEDRCSPYLASDYRYPPSVEPQIAARLGGVRSKYTGRVFHSLQETDSEHIVARSEAHDSGLCSADRETRRAFAADLLNLTLAATSAEPLRQESQGRGGLDAGAEPLLVCTPGGQGKA